MVTARLSSWNYILVFIDTGPFIDIFLLNLYCFCLSICSRWLNNICLIIGIFPC